jgi:protein SCO1
MGSPSFPGTGVSMKKRNCAGFILVAACVLLAGCQRSAERRFDLKGKVVSVDRDQRQVTLAHESIAGYMDAMTMPFSVRDDWAVPVLAPGQEVIATLVVREDRSWIEGLRISKAENSAEPAAANPGPRIGDVVPDFELVNQDGRRIHLGQYRGQWLLLSFIYTRCPLPDYCPRTSRNFFEIYQAIQSRPKSEASLHLLTVSFDTEHDTPAVLKEYSGRYMHPARFQTWEFATGSPDEIRAITGYFGLIYRPEFGQITHTLVTALIGPDGKIVQLYRDNRWKPAEILAAVP